MKLAQNRIAILARTTIQAHEASKLFPDYRREDVVLLSTEGSIAVLSMVLAGQHVVKGYVTETAYQGAHFVEALKILTRTVAGADGELLHLDTVYGNTTEFVA